MKKKAVRMTDIHSCPLYNGNTAHVGGPVLTPNQQSVLIENVLAARVGDQVTCIGPNGLITHQISSGSPNVLIAGKPAARIGDKTSHPGSFLIKGAFTVTIN